MEEFWQGRDWKVKALYSKAGVAIQILVSTIKYDLLIDVGDGVLRDLLEENYDFDRLEAITITTWEDWEKHILSLGIKVKSKNFCFIKQN